MIWIINLFPWQFGFIWWDHRSIMYIRFRKWFFEVFSEDFASKISFYTWKNGKPRIFVPCSWFYRTWIWFVCIWCYLIYHFSWQAWKDLNDTKLAYYVYGSPSKFVKKCKWGTKKIAAAFLSWRYVWRLFKTVGICLILPNLFLALLLRDLRFKNVTSVHEAAKKVDLWRIYK